MSIPKKDHSQENKGESRRNAKSQFSNRPINRSATTGRFVAVTHETYRSADAPRHKTGVENNGQGAKENGFDPNFADKLLELRQKIVESGQPLLSWDEINEEAARRRGKLSESHSDLS